MNTILLLAAGDSKRMKTDKSKCLLRIDRMPTICYSIELFESLKSIHRIIIVCREQDIAEINKLVRDKSYSKVKAVISGGSTRQKSVINGLHEAEKIGCKKDDIILIHNGVNPFVSAQDIRKVLAGAKKYGACACGHCLYDTIKSADKDSFVVETLKSNSYFAAQTPQAIRIGLFIKAISDAQKKGFIARDDVSLIEQIGKPVYLIEASSFNYKLTDRDDLKKARFIAEHVKNSTYRVGMGLDSHTFSSHAKGLTLGGVYFKDEPACEANSDGDVVLHALFNAISSALGGESLGKTADSLCLQEGIKDSKEYIKILFKRYKGFFEIVNLSLALECNQPKIDPIAPKLKRSLSVILKIPLRKIGITATSGQGMKDFGKGIRCSAVVLMRNYKT